jgi:hypothetical protein
VLAAVYVAFSRAHAETIIIYSIILLGAVMIVFTTSAGWRRSSGSRWCNSASTSRARSPPPRARANINGGFRRGAGVGAQFDKFDFVDFGWRRRRTRFFADEFLVGAAVQRGSFRFNCPLI